MSDADYEAQEIADLQHLRQCRDQWQTQAEHLHTELSQVKEQLDREMGRVEAVRNYALEHIEKGKSGGLVSGNATGRGTVGEQLLEILERP